MFTFMFAKITQYRRSDKNDFRILIIVDDFADDPSFTHKYKLLCALYTRGTCNIISSMPATQKINANHPIIRVNATEL